jgi:gamma-F420-2:alpha-L-glutamate ligase
MKTIWLVYESDNVARNRFFIEQWQKAAQHEDVQIHLVIYEEMVYGIKEGRPWLEHTGGLPLPDAAVMRLNQPLLSAHLETMGIPVFNNARVARICNDKRLTHQLVSGIVLAMDTVFLRGDEIDSPLPYPVVLKAVSSCGGRKVFLVKDHEAFQAALATSSPDKALVQALCDTPGKDVRAYVLGKEIIAVMMRYSQHDFRSNLGQGGGAMPYRLSAKDEQMVRKLISTMDFGLVGIDFLFHGGKLVFNEIEDAVGTRMLFAHGYDDIVYRYLRFILNTLEKK